MLQRGWRRGGRFLAAIKAVGGMICLPKLSLTRGGAQEVCCERKTERDGKMSYK